MAIVVDNIYTKGISGRIGDQLLYKQYSGKTVVSIFPKRNLNPPTSAQLAQRQKFALAVFKTRTWLANKAKRIFLEGIARKWAAHSTYHAGITYFMAASTATAGSAEPPPNVGTDSGQRQGAVNKPVTAKGASPAQATNPAPSNKKPPG